MKFSTDKHEKYVVIRLDESKFTNDNTPALKSEFILLNTEGYRNIVVDLSKVKTCNDTQDLSCLLVGNRLCKSAGGIFIAFGINPEIDKIIQVSNLQDAFIVVNKLEEATDLIFMEELERELRGTVDKG